jgi:hypothetical protein
VPARYSHLLGRLAARLIGARQLRRHHRINAFPLKVHFSSDSQQAPPTPQLSESATMTA